MVLASGSTNAKSRAFTVRLFLSNLRLQQFETDGDFDLDSLGCSCVERFLRKLLAVQIDGERQRDSTT